MKKIILAGVSAAALLAGLAPASAADVARRTTITTKAPAYVTPAYNWTGPYVGIVGGGGWGDADFSAPFPGSFDTSGALIGGTLGYNWQAGQIVFGVEGDINWSDISGSGACGVAGCSVENDWLGTVRGRLGYAAGSFMPYVTGGVAFGGVDTTIGGASTSSTQTGWTVGAGIEAQISGPLTAKIEYLYVDLGDSDPIAGSSADFTTNIVRAGLNYRF